MYNIAFGAYGSAFTFTKKNLKRSNGTVEYWKYLRTLCAIPNIDKIYLLSPSDYYSAPSEDVKEVDPYNKLVIIWDGKAVKSPAKTFEDLTSYNFNDLKDLNDLLPKKTGYYCVGAAQKASTQQLVQTLKDVKIDQIILYMSQGVSNWNTPDAKKTKFGVGNQCLCMGMNYTSPIAQYLNEHLDIPYYLILPDPRWGGAEKWGILIDNFKTAESVMTQYDSIVEWRHVTKYDNTKTTKEFEYKYDKIKFEYKETEKVTTIGVTPTSPENERTTEFAIAAMQATPEYKWEEDYRFKELKKWVLDKNPDGSWHIYGNWAQAAKDKYSNFKGMLSSDQVDETFKNTKYTLIIPIAKNWVTSKYVEMLATGCVPFFHPDYDTQCHVLPKDHFIRISDPNDLAKKISFLNKYPEERYKLVKALQEKIFKDITDGSFLTRTLNETNKTKNIDIRYENPVFKIKKPNKLTVFIGD